MAFLQHYARRGKGRVTNPPQAASLPHNAGDSKIVAAREETRM
jgi:hypothetical protein